MDEYELQIVKETYRLLDSATIEMMNTSIPPGSRRECARNLIIDAMSQLDLLVHNLSHFQKKTNPSLYTEDVKNEG